MITIQFDVLFAQPHAHYHQIIPITFDQLVYLDNPALLLQFLSVILLYQVRYHQKCPTTNRPAEYIYPLFLLLPSLALFAIYPNQYFAIFYQAIYH
jgi:hypothetical protein